MWRLRVLARDNHKCQECNSPFRLEVHHKKSFISIVKKYRIITMKKAYKCKSLWNLDNGQTLCHKCHKKTDSYKKKPK